EGIGSSDGSVITASIDGPFLPERYFPKLTSSLSVSYQQSETPGINDRGGRWLRGAMKLSWEARERTKVHAQISRALELTANDMSVERTTYLLGADQGIGHAWTAHGSVSFEQLGFRGFD